MSAGHVVVSGPRFEQRLGAGQRLVATVEGGIVSLESAPPPPAEAPAAAPAPPPPALRPPHARRTAAPAPDWSARLAAGDFASVVARAEAEGIDVALGRRSLADLQALATAARLAHRGELARRTYLVERARFPASEGAREAAFHLGRLAEDVEGDRGAAVGWYDRYLGESPRGLLAAEALGRKMAALHAVGAPAASVARQYLTRFPDGARAGLARTILQGQ
jgi:hypothetical protein